MSQEPRSIARIRELTGDRLSRRAVLGLLGAGGIATVTGCQIDTGDSAGAGGAADSNPKAIKFPDFDTELPTEDVTFRWVDSGDLKSVWEQSVLDAFTEKHPNVKTQYDGSGWDTVNQVVPLGIRNKSAHDVFALPEDIPPQVAINEGWVQPIEELIPDFDGWKANFPATALVPGVSIFNDKLYSWPISSARRLSRMAMYDTAVMEQAGYDKPEEQISTWDDLTEALAKVVQQGKTGLMAAGDGIDGLITYLSYTAGWPGITGRNLLGGLDFGSGEYCYAHDATLQTYEWFAKLVKDKIVVPGYLSLLEKDARAQMTAGKAGMIFNGPWDIPAWKKTAPDWKYTIAPMPTPEADKSYTVPFHEGSNSSWVYAETKLPTVVGQILAYMGSPEGQKMMVILSEGNLQSLQPEANEAADQPGLLDENAKFANSLALDLMRIAPRPELRNPDVAKVTLEFKPVVPTFKDIMQGLLTGKLKNAKAEFAKYDSALSGALDDAIAAAMKKGSTATRDDFRFDNWDRTKDYGDADYQALS